MIACFGALPQAFEQQLQGLRRGAGLVLLVDNNPRPALAERLDPAATGPAGEGPEGFGALEILWNGNRGGLAGGFNRGVERARERGARWITLLDQDSTLPPGGLAALRRPWSLWPEGRWLVGPQVIDAQRRQRHGRWQPYGQEAEGLDCTRHLISSGTTFLARDWPLLGPLHEGLFIDYLDHDWCFRAQARGFVLLQSRAVALQQQFGRPHPNPLCRACGMQLYSPLRHYHSLRNLRWLLRQPHIPADLKAKELLKMLLKPWCWLAFEPDRRTQARLLLRALRAPLPGPAPGAAA
ncbi:glycosyltransferase [Synechococcus sp. RSCCF101]|uniref:glycosyltransferase n=1 Tax=Synechococcus sp. RSCCF101 TaxID=2511069 RepID=UPI001780275F|nr:glycosyltransferase [Synechococcus sp. RSCCF101]